MEDLPYKSKSSMFNCRMVGVCVKEGKVFISKLKDDKFWTFVGRKPHILEPTDVAVIREFEEETGAKLQLDRLAVVIEKFFEFQSNNWHQYNFFYILKDENNELVIFEGERTIKDNAKGVYKWIYIKDLEMEKFAPACFTQIFARPEDGMQHIINRFLSKDFLVY